jgi:hypothetical protein
MVKKSILLVLGLFLGIAGQLFGSSLDQWQLEASQPPNVRFNDVTYGENQFVCVGGVNSTFFIATSPDGVDWTYQNTGLTTNDYPGTAGLDGVCFGNGMFVAKGSAGIVLTSTDATNWVSQYDSLEIPSLSFANGHFIKQLRSGINRRIETSVDGTNWIQSASSLPDDLSKVIFAGNKYMGVGRGGVIFTSPDTVSWTTQNAGTTNDLSQVVYGNGKFMAVGSVGTILASTNGINWTPQNSGTTNDLYCINFANGVFVTAGDGWTVITSADGISWTNHFLPTQSVNGSTQPFRSITCGGGRLVMVGELKRWNDLNPVAISDTKGDTWKFIYNIWTGMTHGNNTFVSVGSMGNYCASTNGLDWTRGITAANYDVNSVAYGDGQFVAVGDYGTIQTSSDGINWALHSSGTNLPLRVLAFGNHTFVAAEQSQNGWFMLKSTNGMDWTRTYGPGFSLLGGIAFGNGMFLAAGSALLKSTNGINWEALPRVGSSIFTAVAFGNGRFVAVGWNGAYLTTSDGVNILSGTVGADHFFKSIAFGADRFVAGTAQGVIKSTADGIRWKDHASPINGELNAAAYGDGQFAFAGNKGILLQSGPAFSLRNTLNPGSGATLTLTGQKGRTYRIQTSDSPVNTNWADLVTFTNNAESMQFLDATATNRTAHFYRAVSP